MGDLDGRPDAEEADEGCTAAGAGCGGFAFVPNVDAFQRGYRLAALLGAVLLVPLVCFILP